MKNYIVEEPSMKGKFILFISVLFMLTSCEQLALFSTPQKHPIASKNAAAAKAQQYFWETLHSGRYHDIEKADSLLTAAYLKNPNDPKLAAHLGFLHIWKITERQRLSSNDPLITNEIILADKYFSDALTLMPGNPIYQSFWGDTQLIQGDIFKNKRQEVHGYFILKKAIAAWPEFNYFTAGYPISTLSADSPHFKEGLTWQWRTLDRCAGKKISHKNPDFSSVMKQETRQGQKRACWNSWIAPYNFEGFFMNMGDMLVKSGDLKTAVLIYKNARLAKNYDSWPYKDALEYKIQHAESNKDYFQKDHNIPNRSIMFNSGYGCMACHQSH